MNSFLPGAGNQTTRREVAGKPAAAFARETALVTGGTGFIGRHLISALLGSSRKVRALTRAPGLVSGWEHGPVIFVGGDLTSPETLSGLCDDVTTVFHLAGYTHATDNDADDLHGRITVEGTRALLVESARAGVRRFIFVSSVKAMGEGGEQCLDETSPAWPASVYGRAKRQAEEMVLEAGTKHGMHVTVLRLPLVYGPGVKGNLHSMIEAIDRRRFPPPPRIANRRSLVHVEDVVQALLLAADKPMAAGNIYIVADGKDYSTREIYDLICHALGRPVPRWSVPFVMLRVGALVGDLTGRLRGRPFVLNSEALSKLLGSAYYSSDRIHRELGFVPHHTFESALPAMIAHYRTVSDVS